MKIKLSKFKIVLLLLSSIIILSACSESKSTDDNQSASEQQNIQDEKENMDTEGVAPDVESGTTENLDIPKSTFKLSSIEGESVFYMSDIDGVSELTSETIEVLTEFDAEDIDEGTKLTLPEDILFDYDSFELLPDADEAIQKLDNLAQEVDGDITIIGHTDSHGEDDYNQKLSEDRAEAVLDSLVDSGVDEERLSAEGKGATEPIAENTMSDGSDNPEGREKNRRVEVIIHGFEQ